MQNTFILVAVALAGAMLVWPRLSKSTHWRAMITPLASIIGSGFLVLGPILNASYGKYAPLIMLALCGIAYLFGHAIRYNIATISKAEQTTPRPRLARQLETVSSWILSFAYVISVAYYLNLLGAFGMRLTPFDTPTNARLLTSAVFIIILLIGWSRGFSALERMEQISVGVKLAIIMGLLVGMAFYFAERADQGALLMNPPTLTGWPAITLAFGLLITVQGFETSRYLGDTYDACTRIRSMKHAQWMSTSIYLIYILLLAYVFSPGSLNFSETEIIDMMQIVAPILPLLLIIAALSAQFSAAIADTGGAGGLIEELTENRLQPRHAYAALVVVGLMLTWAADVFQIIAYASRAFALYYGVQAAIAAVTAARNPGHNLASWWFASLAGLGFAIAILGRAVEGG
ncbi:membrane protein [Marinosulfonomonas sp. PRT-SC04]|nr:membrane protein [Marinosulfonomonas sp. PRT-SC04]